VTYELVNRVTGNTLDSFESERAALSALAEFCAVDEAFAGEFVLVAFDDAGEAVKATPAADRAAHLA
jgi:hypothetical protein